MGFRTPPHGDADTSSRNWSSPRSMRTSSLGSLNRERDDKPSQKKNDLWDILPGTWFFGTGNLHGFRIGGGSKAPRTGGRGYAPLPQVMGQPSGLPKIRHV